MHEQRPRSLPGRVVSGGQTGVDRAALDWAIAHGIEHGGWCPSGRRAEDGPIPSRSRLAECDSASYERRTRLNVRDSDATLILSTGSLDGGTAKTIAFAKQAGKPCRVVDLEAAPVERVAAEIADWLAECTPTVLNVAGPRESERPGVAARAREVLDLCMQSSCRRRLTWPSPVI